MTLVTEIAMGTIDPARAGSASAVLETSSEFGGALGIAVLGSIGAAIYGSAMDSRCRPVCPTTPPRWRGKPWPERRSSRPNCRATAAPQVLAAARDAFTSGMHGVGMVGAVIMIAAGAVCVLFLRRAVVVDLRSRILQRSSAST